ncbi:MAG: Crp/Fnr family transcriptional regulator [Armatimonadetes bacterium]|nr:Crp/Fnr family transcriptional regulator [Armatimonadota bacterium]MDW8120818.1 Crp/Fnr family transcriptional regulator [Armatimonadota bacterium]
MAAIQTIDTKETQQKKKTPLSHPLLRAVSGVRETFKKGEFLFYEGDPPQWLYLIEEGKVVLSKAVRGGGKTIVAVCTRGNLVGELPVFDREPYDTDATALTDVVAYRLSREALLYALRSRPALAEHIITDLAARLRQAQETIRLLSTVGVERRLASLLLALLSRFGKRTQEGVALDPSFTRYGLAAMAGTTIETTVRVLSDWAQRGIIRKHRRQIIVINTKELAEIARK